MVTAKFKVSRLSPFGFPAEQLREKLDSEEPVTCEVELTPDYAQGKNAEWASATPSGVLRMTVQNKAALEQFFGEGYLGTGKSFRIELHPEDE